MKNLLIMLAIPVAGAFSNICSAQATLNAAGGSAAIAGNTYEWSFAEMVLVNTAATPGLAVTQGVLQPTAGTTGISDPKPAWDALSIYPNPVNDQLNIKFNVGQHIDLDLVISDISGRQYEVRSYKDHHGTSPLIIDFSAYAAGIYTLQLESTHNSKTYLNTYKIVKN